MYDTLSYYREEVCTDLFAALPNVLLVKFKNIKFVDIVDLVELQ
jgi:hypothetical protein